MPSGVYTITCIPTGRKYVGSSVNVQRRWYCHKNALKKGKHKNVLLQRAWDKYGEDAFIFEILVTTAPEDMLDVEQEQLDSGEFFAPNGFNIMKSVSWITEAVRNKMAASHTGKKHSASTREKLALANRTIPRKNAKQVQQIDENGIVVATWKSINAAAKGVGRDFKSLWQAVKHPHLTCAGYSWKAV